MVLLDRSGKQSHNWFCQQIDEIKETIDELNDSLDDNEEVYSNESKEESKDIESHPAYFILSYPLGNHKIETVVFTRLRLGTSIIIMYAVDSRFGKLVAQGSKVGLSQVARAAGGGHGQW